MGHRLPETLPKGSQPVKKADKPSGVLSVEIHLKIKHSDSHSGTVCPQVDMWPCVQTFLVVTT